jgi:hypothetical protein
MVIIDYFVLKNDDIFIQLKSELYIKSNSIINHF